MRRLAVFDCDGTLVDGQADHCLRMESAFLAAGLPAPDHHQVRRLIGISLPQTFLHLAPDAGEEQLLKVREGYHAAAHKSRAEGSSREPLFGGIGELLGRLHRRGWILGVATGKSDPGLRHCLVTHGIFDLFATLQTSDRHPSKPDPSMLIEAMAQAGAAPEDTAMIGDTAYDMEMACAAGVRAIGVGWGYHTSEELLGAGAQAVASDAAELEALLDG